MLIGRLILENHLQNEQMGKTISTLQERYNQERDSVASLNQEINMLKSRYDTSGERVNNP